MKLLLDENISPRLAMLLRSEGHDAIAAVEGGLSGRPDPEVRAYSIATGRVLITLDADFADILRYPPKGTPGVIRLKVHPPTEEAVRQLLSRTLKGLNESSIDGCLAVAHANSSGFAGNSVR